MTLLLTVVLTSFGCAGNNTASNTNAAQGGENARYAPTPSPIAASNQNTVANRSTLPDESTGDATEFDGTAGITEKKNAVIKNVARMSAVRSARHASYDRVVFEFAGAEMPTYHLEYINTPVQQCGSGNTVPFAGDGWLEVRFSDSQAHDGSGNVTIADRERSPNLPVIKDLKITCDFESEVTWVLGVASPNKYRVVELKNPTRLAVDIKN
ncbi:MAG: hypothetical protein WKF92_08560 [Pyrinomonadaceae bacterium]